MKTDLTLTGAFERLAKNLRACGASEDRIREAKCTFFAGASRVLEILERLREMEEADGAAALDKLFAETHDEARKMATEILARIATSGMQS